MTVVRRQPALPQGLNKRSPMAEATTSKAKTMLGARSHQLAKRGGVGSACQA
jgi:hypothetical protein